MNLHTRTGDVNRRSRPRADGLGHILGFRAGGEPPVERCVAHPDRQVDVALRAARGLLSRLRITASSSARRRGVCLARSAHRSAVQKGRRLPADGAFPTSGLSRRLRADDGDRCSTSARSAACSCCRSAPSSQGAAHARPGYVAPWPAPPRPSAQRGGTQPGGTCGHTSTCCTMFIHPDKSIRMNVCAT